MNPSRSFKVVGVQLNLVVHSSQGIRVEVRFYLIFHALEHDLDGTTSG